MFAVAYLIIVFALFYYVLGGIIGMANQVNRIGSPKAAGLIVAVLVLGPFFLLLQLLHQKIELDINSREMIVKRKGKAAVIINLATIHKMEFNATSINRLDIYDRQNNLLINFHPANTPDVAKQIIKEICGTTNFERKAGSKSYFRTRIETLTYTRV